MRKLRFLVIVAGLCAVKPNAAQAAETHLVAKHGTAPFKAIQAAIDSIPARNRERIVVYLRNGIYPGRWGEPNGSAGAVVFLSSAASDYVNGHLLVVDGGWMGR